MNVLVWTLAIVLAVTGGIVPIAAAQDRTLGQKIDDATLTAAVKAKLVADRARNLFKINVDTENGVVRLKGTVPAEEDKIEAERLARRTAGVRDVINELKIEASASDTPREPAAASPRTQ
jgi:hyperosmotically inducible periplasmic protein